MRAQQAASDERLQRVLAMLEGKAELASESGDSPELRELRAAQARTDERIDALMGLMEKVAADKGPRATAAAPRRKRGRPRKQQLVTTQSVGSDALADTTIGAGVGHALGSEA
jgi:hypothetical protein